jgi:protein-disulfide isomerase
MANQKSQNIDKTKKIYFLYFISFTVVILIIFGIIIFQPFWDYTKSLQSIEKYYQGKLGSIIEYTPKIEKTDPVKGSIDAKVTIFEYSDFFCQACKNLQVDLLAIEKLYGNKIRIVYKGLPVTINPENRPSLNAAYCAWEQNNFWPYQDLLYMNNNLLSNSVYQRLAKDLNLDLTTFNQCIEYSKYSAVIENNLAEAINLQISSIPTVYVNTQRIQGLVNYNSLKKAIDQELAKQ